MAESISMAPAEPCCQEIRGLPISFVLSALISAMPARHGARIPDTEASMFIYR